MNNDDNDDNNNNDEDDDNDDNNNNDDNDEDDDNDNDRIVPIYVLTNIASIIYMFKADCSCYKVIIMTPCILQIII